MNIQKIYFLFLLIFIPLVCDGMQREGALAVNARSSEFDSFFQKAELLLDDNQPEIACAFIKEHTSQWKTPTIIAAQKHPACSQFLESRTQKNDTDTLYTFGNLFMRAQRVATEDTQKKDLALAASKSFQQIYLNKENDQALRFAARRNLEGLYAKFPTLKVTAVTNQFAQERKLKLPEINPRVNARPAAEGVDSEKLITDYFSSAEHRKLYSQKLFGADLEMAREAAAQKAAEEKAERKKITKEKIAAAQKIKEKAAQKAMLKEKEQRKFAANDTEKSLMGVCEDLFNRKEFDECAQTCWQLLNLSETKEAKTSARKRLQLLNDEKKSIHATYYLVLLNQESPERMLDLFLQAESRRDLEAERKNAEILLNEASLIEKINEQNVDADESVATATSLAMMEAQKAIYALACQNNPRALHALTIYYCHQAHVFPATQIGAYRSAAASAKRLHELGKTFKGGSDYSLILNYLGSALYKKVTGMQSSQALSTTMNLLAQRDLYEAERLLQLSSDLKNTEATFNLGLLQEFRFRNHKEFHKLNQALTNFIDAVKKGSAQAAEHVETLLVEGIDSIPLNIAHRIELISTLREKNPKSHLLQKKDFKNSRYYSEAKKSDAVGNLEFYEGLYWFDHKEYPRALALLGEARDKLHQGATIFMLDARISTDLQENNSKTIVTAIDSAWAIIPQMKHPDGALLLSTTLRTLDKLVNENNIDAMYKIIQGHLSGFLDTDQNTIKNVNALLNKAEALLIKDSTHPLRQKITQNKFITDLLDFAKRVQSPAILYTIIHHTLERFKLMPREEEAYELVKLIMAITKDLNDDLHKKNRVYVPCPESSTALSQEIKQFILLLENEDGSDAIPLSKDLHSLQLILAGKPQAGDALLEQPGTEKISVMDALNVHDFARHLIGLFDVQTKKTEQAIYKKNDAEISIAMRTLISKFRKDQVAVLYHSLSEVNGNAFALLERYVASKKAENLVECFSIMNLKLILIANRALTDAKYPVDKAFEHFCITHPILGAAMVARELVGNELVSLDKTKAVKYLKRAQQEAALCDQRIESYIFIKEVAELIERA